MHAFLVPENPEKHPPGIDTLYLTPEISIGIEDIRRVAAFLSRKPLREKQNVVVICQAEKLTLPAQQALLKTLEEPPGNSLIYLVTAKPEVLLPTILSRVVIVENVSKLQADDQKQADYQKLFSRLAAAGEGERLEILDSREFTRETALEFLDYLEIIIHRDFQNFPNVTGIYPLLAKTRKYLKANVSLKLALDNFVIKL